MNVRRITSVPMSGPATYGPDAGSITRWTI
ncbi:hypothetical protein YUMDRAFT_06032 [Streptomyces sp. OspMP-M45]|nr:hypothetical protein YUMDRAFT_06032 [Streptomyces sp. OspMP-M45]